MPNVDTQALATQVLWGAFALAAVFGAVAQRTHFCTMGAVADIVHMGDWSRLRMWALSIGVAMLGFNAMVALGWVEAGKTLYAAPRWTWLSGLVGGLMFGFGMVLASGCGSKTLVRIGGGNLKSLVVFALLGLSAFATLKGIAAVARVSTLDRAVLEIPGGQDLPAIVARAVGVGPAPAALGLGLLIGGALIAWALGRREGRSREVLLGGFGIGAVIVAMWWISGVLGHVTEHPETLEEVFLVTNSGRMESLSFVAPVAYTVDWLLWFSDASKTLTVGIVSTFGVVAGSAAAALAAGTFRWEGFGGVEDTANHVVGALLMGMGGVTALGCTVGQGLSGVSTLALGSFAALAAIVAGALLALRYQRWRVEREHR
ncbi:MAG TPA: YeeE/YedE family protein [Burkholderiaceae bacterium]|nr:YeeE/YedE family protein [Burkholderiaceae bacterium]